MALALVLVFSVTRVIFIPQGELVAFARAVHGGAAAGSVPGTLWLLLRPGCGRLWLVEAWRSAAAAAARRTGVDARVDRAVSCARRRRWCSAATQPLRAAGADARCWLVTPLGPAGVPAGLPAAGRRQRAGAADRLGRRCISRWSAWACCSSAPRARARRLSRTARSSSARALTGQTLTSWSASRWC